MLACLRSARPFALQEAERARRIFAFREERYYLNMAQASLPQDNPERLRLLQRMGMLSMSIYELAEALQWLDMAKDGYQRRGEYHQALSVMANLLLAHWQIGSPLLMRLAVEIETAAEHAFADLDSTGGDIELLAATALFAHYWTVHSLYSRSARWLERCFALFESLNDPGKVPVIQLPRMTRGWYKTHKRSRDFEEGIFELREAIDAASAYRLPDVIMIGHTTLAQALIFWGRTDEAERTLQEAAEHEERSGTLLPTFVYGLHYFFAGKAWEQAIIQLRSQIERLDRLQVAYLAAAARVSLAHILLARGELQEAEMNLQAAQPALEQNDEYIYLVPFWWEYAKLHTIRGNPQQARHEYERIFMRWKTAEDTLTIFPMLLDGITFYAEIGDLSHARLWLGELEAALQLTDNPVGMTALEEAQGIVAAAQGDMEKAMTYLRQAVEAWDRLKWRHRHALALERLAKELLAWARKPSLTRSIVQRTREEAALLLEQAAALYTELDIPAGIAAVQALRSETRLEAQQKRRHTLLARYGWQGLTPREREVLSQLAAGLSNKEIAAALHISTGTVEQHVSHILGQLGCDTRTQAVAIALENGWIKGIG